MLRDISLGLTLLDVSINNPKLATKRITSLVGDFIN